MTSVRTGAIAQPESSVNVCAILGVTRMSTFYRISIYESMKQCASEEELKLTRV